MILATARSQHTTPRAFIWNDHGRFVEVHPVRLGWLVVWGRHEDLGSIRIQEGNAQYRTLHGARRRVVDAALEVTQSHRTAADAARMFDFFSFPEHKAGTLPEPL